MPPNSGRKKHVPNSGKKQMSPIREETHIPNSGINQQSTKLRENETMKTRNANEHTRNKSPNIRENPRAHVPFVCHPLAVLCLRKSRRASQSGLIRQAEWRNKRQGGKRIVMFVFAFVDDFSSVSCNGVREYLKIFTEFRRFSWMLMDLDGFVKICDDYIPYSGLITSPTPV
jgi:hypothetical protein